MAIIQLGAGNTPQQTFVSWKDPDGDPLVAVNRDGTISAQGVIYGDGTKQTTASGGGTGILDISFTLSSAQILALNTTGIQVIAAPGTGKYINVIGASLELIAGATPYTITSVTALVLKYPSDSIGNWLWGITNNSINGGVAGFLDQAINTLGYMVSAGANSQHYSNAAVNIQAVGANPSAGNGTIKGVIQYTVETA